MFGVPRSPVLLALIALALLVAGLDWLLVRSPSVPPEYLGIWQSPEAGLEVQENGVVEYWHREGLVTTTSGGRLRRIGADTLTYRVFFVPTHLRIDSPPHRTGEEWQLTIEGHSLTRQP